MSVVEPGSSSSNLIERVKNILTKPKETWDVIDAEPATVGGLYRGYIIPLAAIPAICGFIGMTFIGAGAFGISVKYSLVGGLVQAIVSYALTLAGVFVTALIIDALAPTFGGTKNQIQAMKVATYAATASWVAGVFQIIPMLAVLAILGALYSLYLLYLGLPKLMKSPEDKTIPYIAVVIIVCVVIAVVIGMVTAPLRLIGGGIGGLAASNAAQGSVTLPGGASVDLGKAEAAAEKARVAAEKLQSGEGVEVTDPEALKAFLPENLNGFARGDVSSGSGGVGGMTGSNAEASYAKGGATMKLSITDMGAAGALAGMANAFNVKSSNESNGRYEKIGRVDGRMTTETYDRNTNHGEYGVMVADRFMVQAEGDGVTIGDLKAAVASVGLQKLEGLAKGG